MTSSSRAELVFPENLRDQFEPYLPAHGPVTAPLQQLPRGQAPKPHVTLAYAQSIDSSIALVPGEPTAISGEASKSMTHYLRMRHDAIMVGCGTAMADDPTLNSRLTDAEPTMQPRPVILDRLARWIMNGAEFDHKDTKLVRAARQGKGKGPLVFVDTKTVDGLWQSITEETERYDKDVTTCGGMVIPHDTRQSFETILEKLASLGVRSVMVEGGGDVINRLLSESGRLVDTVIVTIAPVYFGEGGVDIRPLNATNGAGSDKRRLMRFRDVRWVPLGNDIVMCGRNER